jgi:hypothetical protein
VREIRDEFTEALDSQIRLQNQNETVNKVDLRKSSKTDELETAFATGSLVDEVVAEIRLAMPLP